MHSSRKLSQSYDKLQRRYEAVVFRLVLLLQEGMARLLTGGSALTSRLCEVGLLPELLGTYIRGAPAGGTAPAAAPYWRGPALPGLGGGPPRAASAPLVL
jgi:hypothetical protein